ncbi:MAG: hypothetical protein IPJ54_12975 [Saprospiraceae bacterium]|nr:hypothetical protein [Saprospiraceae bacterium]
MLKNIVALFSIGLLIASCGKDTSSYTDKVDCSGIDADQNTYNKTIKTIVDGSCAYSGCHDSKTAAEGIDLSTYAKTKSEFVSGNALCTVYQDCKPMPQGTDQLDQETLDQLTCWVKNGAPQ